MTIEDISLEWYLSSNQKYLLISYLKKSHLQSLKPIINKINPLNCAPKNHKSLKHSQLKLKLWYEKTETHQSKLIIQKLILTRANFIMCL